MFRGNIYYSHSPGSKSILSCKGKIYFVAPTSLSYNKIFDFIVCPLHTDIGPHSFVAYIQNEYIDCILLE